MNSKYNHLNELNKLSEKLGQQPLLIQGAGGNTSIKEDSILWVKASGKWLADAGKENIFVPVDLLKVRQDITNNMSDPVSKHVLNESLRPSIEATLHALLPHKVVLHVHSVNTLAWAVNKQGEQLLGKLLHGLKWAWIPYCRPGLELTHAINAKLHTNPDILILANHGLVIGAESCADAENLLNQVEARLQRQPRTVANYDTEFLKAIQNNTDWILPAESVIHGLATDDNNFTMAITGAMYPDHVVFLQAVAPHLITDQFEVAADFIKSCTVNYILLKDKGVLVSPTMSIAAQQMLLCQALLLQRLQPTDEISYLADEDIDRLLNWEAEKYRQRMIK